MSSCQTELFLPLLRRSGDGGLPAAAWKFHPRRGNRVAEEEPIRTGVPTAETPVTDLDLVRLAAGGDGSAFNALVDRHGAELFQLAASLSRTRADAEDIVQETLIGALKGLSKFDARASVKTWLKRILVRQAARAWNRSKRWRETRPMDTVEQSPGPALGVPSSTPSVDRRLDVAAVLATLSPEHREVLVLREFQQMSYSEMADVLDVPQGTIESRLHRARAELRSKLNGYNA